MSTRRWTILYYALFGVFIIPAALNMLHVPAGFLTSYAADLAVPAWMYISCRGLQSKRPRTRFVDRVFGRSPERAALTLFLGCTATEVGQRFWPHGLFSGRFDPLDIAAYALGLAAVYALDRGFFVRGVETRAELS